MLGQLGLDRSEGTRKTEDIKSRVEWLILLRLFITFFILAITILLQFRESRYFDDNPATPLFILVGAIFALSLLYALSLDKIGDLSKFSFFQICIDTVYSTVLVQLTGGASSSFTLLYVFPVLAAGILHLRRGALFIASMSSVLLGGLVTLQFYDVIPQSLWPWASLWRNNDPSYVLWVLIIHYALFFSVALLSGTVSEQLKNTRISLTLREMEYERLSDLHTNIIESIPSGIITSDEEDVITFVNEVGVDVLKTEPSGLIGRPLTSVFQALKTVDRETRAIQSYTMVLRDESGQKREIDLSLGKLWDRTEKPLGHLAVFQDVTDVRRLERRAKQNETQAAFLRIASGMAHEIRNPLASLRGAAELLMRPVGEPAHQAKLLAIVIREADRLNALLSDFILTVDGRQAKSARFSLTKLLADTLEEFESSHCVPHGLHLVADGIETLEIAGQADRLRQAFLSVLTNSAEASPDGSEIRVRMYRDADEVIVSIEDRGSGVPPEIRNKIFEPFFTTKSFGTGLGLSMALSIVEAHGGSIESRDNEPKGTVFTVRLPVGQEESRPGVLDGA
jgi:two-component system sensor histidine kinase PilS (NtrC family)